MTYRAILFDMNGVLVDDEDIQEQAFRNALATIDVNLSSSEFIKYFIGKTDTEGLRDFLPLNENENDATAILDLKHSEYNKLIVGSIKGYEGVTDFINRAIERGLMLSVVTSTAYDEAKANLSSLDLLSYFKKIITGDNVTNGKPDPEGYLKGASLLDVKPEECIVIEDAPSGVAAAKAAGMFSVAVLNTHSAEDLKDASIIVNKLSADLIDKLVG